MGGGGYRVYSACFFEGVYFRWWCVLVGLLFKGVFRWLWCTVYMRHHLYLVSSIPYVLQGCRLKKKLT